MCTSLIWEDGVRRGRGVDLDSQVRISNLLMVIELLGNAIAT